MSTLIPIKADIDDAPLFFWDKASAISMATPTRIMNMAKLAHFYLLLAFYVLADGGRWAAGYSLRLVNWWLNMQKVQAAAQDIDIFKSPMVTIP